MAKNQKKFKEWYDEESDWGKIDSKRYDKKKSAIKEARKNKWSEKEKTFEE